MEEHGNENRSLPHRAPSEIDRMVGQRVKFRRMMLGISQQELGETCSISPQQIHKYERGQSGMRASRIAQFAVALDVPVHYFFETVCEDTVLPNDLIEILADSKNAEMILLFDRIEDDAVRDTILEMARSYHRVRGTSGSSVPESARS
ncbi:MAG: helix-turn-helix transcriptional regulator [Pseudomonadota bacterium]